MSRRLKPKKHHNPHQKRKKYMNLFWKRHWERHFAINVEHIDSKRIMEVFKQTGLMFYSPINRDKKDWVTKDLLVYGQARSDKPMREVVRFSCDACD